MKPSELGFWQGTSDSVRALSRPEIVTPLGKKRGVSVQARTLVEWFEPEGDELYRRYTKDVDIGLKVQLEAVRYDAEKDALRLEIEIARTEITDRNPVAGTQLPVGRPSIKSTAVATGVVVEREKLCLAQCGGAEDTQLVLEIKWDPVRTPKS